MKRQLIYGAIVPLTIGIILYLLFRPTTIFLFRLTEMVGLKNIIEHLRSEIIQGKMPDWIIYNVPDGLWSFALTTTMLQHWENKVDLNNTFWIIFIPLFGISLELFQKWHLISGTFDMADIFAILIGFAFSISIFTRNIKTSIA